MEQALIKLSQYTGAPAVTILLSTHRTFPDNKQDSIHLKNLITQVEKELYEQYDKRTVWPVIDKIKEAENDINHAYNLDTLALFACSDFVQVKRLPITTTDRYVIGDRFEIRPLLKAVQQSEHYYILSVSRQKIRLLEAFNDKIEHEVQNADFPYTNSYYTTDPMRQQQDLIVDNLLREFFNTADKRFKKYYAENPLPVILLGEEKNLTYYQEVMDIKGLVVATHHGSFDDTSDAEIATVTFPLILKYIAGKQETAMQAINTAQSAQRLLVDLNDIYTAAENGQADTLYIEQTFLPTGHIDNGTISVGDGNGSSDITLPVIDAVINKGGNVVFLDENALNEYQGIALVTRF
ncbi:hypothetical protein SAMN04488128_108145 [Chitinophaga eiseniae]|uniref:Uncharacterized protein n=1 Tax=Chitinophaga eiseniae TaxID=634771 RepID=A0A1T4U3K9_9BACT|nr:hypothetical protein [Chitinophaga eiseniae]SKA47267.1 hypothetical protein SAMN04488128_108145 [Chitinophaga eiseniae]